jgi:signal transduction histidine kinase
VNPAFSTTMPLPKGGRHRRRAALRALPPPAGVMARLLAPEVHATPAPLGMPAWTFEAAWQPKPVAPPAAEVPDTADRMLPAQADLLAVVAHELRNGLMPIRLAAAQLRSAGKDELSLVRLRVTIERQLDHMARLVGDLLDISRPGSGSLRLERVQVDMGKVLSEALAACRPGMEAREQHLQLDLPAVLPAMEGDPVRLAQVARNLLDNASKYSPRGACISVSVIAKDGALAMTVADNGIGITAEVLPHIFERFVQDPHAVAFNGAGLGIGLSVVREWVQAHGGDVIARSAGRGQGSQFVVTLPLGRSEPATGEPGVSMARPPACTSGAPAKPDQH